jgi:beta-lactamase class A
MRAPRGVLRGALALALALAAAAPARPARADDPDDGASIPVPIPDEDDVDVIEDPVIAMMRRLDELAPFEDKAPLRRYRDERLQGQLDALLDRLGLAEAVARRHLGVALVDVTRPDRPRLAEANGDVMMYAASLPKIAVLLAAFEKIAQGKMELTPEVWDSLSHMIRESSNVHATRMMHRVGKEYIARVLLDPRYRLYDPKRNGGLWVGKDYAKAGLWKRDPLHNFSHGATPIQVARFYYLLETENLVTPEYCRKMKELLAHSAIDHKFIKGLRLVNPRAMTFRKSGTWRTYHSDSVLVEGGGHSYIAVGLAHDGEGGTWLRRLIVGLDEIIYRDSPRWTRRGG